MDLGKLAEMGERRECRECGGEFWTDKDGYALEKFADHTAVHNPTPAQWNHAYHLIQEARAGEKKRQPQVEG
jgi:hypothetical protein